MLSITSIDMPEWHDRSHISYLINEWYWYVYCSVWVNNRVYEHGDCRSCSFLRFLFISFSFVFVEINSVRSCSFDMILIVRLESLPTSPCVRARSCSLKICSFTFVYLVVYVHQGSFFGLKRLSTNSNEPTNEHLYTALQPTTSVLFRGPNINIRCIHWIL